MANPKSARSLSSPRQRPEAAENTTQTPIRTAAVRDSASRSRIAAQSSKQLEQANAENHAILVV